MSQRGVKHYIKHDKAYFEKLLKEGAVFRHENHGAYNTTDVGPKPTFNFLDDARKGTDICAGLNQPSLDPFLIKGVRNAK